MSVEDAYEAIWKRKLLAAKHGRHEKECQCRVCVASRLVEPCQRVLDVGCGDGYLAESLGQKCREAYGVDISSEALRVAQKRGVKTEKVDLNSEPLPFQNNWFDTAVSLDVIEHVLNPDSLLAEINRVLRPKGHLIISTTNMRWWKHLVSLIWFGRFPRTSNDPEAYDGGHLHYFTYKDMENLLEKHHFEVIGRYAILGKDFLREFRSPGSMIKAEKI